MSDIGDLLEEHNIANHYDYTDEELLDMKGIGPATLEKIRNRKIVSKMFLHLEKDNAVYSVVPGDVIPEEYDPMKYVKRGQAEWQ